MSLKYQELLAQARKSSGKMSGSDSGSSRLANMGRSSRGRSRFVDEDDDAKLGGIMGKKRSGNSELESLEEERDFMSKAFDKVYASNKSMSEAIAEKDKASAMKSTGASGEDDFLSQLTESESSGNSKADRTNKDGRRFSGLIQFGEDRLSDAKKALNIAFTTDEFKNDLTLQDRVAKWHIKSIDKSIGGLAVRGKYKSNNGLRAVAHLGGEAGMKKFVESGGVYNPKDELGTSLSDYYTKFSSIEDDNNV